MAEEVQIAGTPARAKIRSPWAAALLPIITLSIYYFVWYYKINREMRDLGKARNSDELGDSPGTSLLAVTLGALIIIPAIVSVVHTAQRIQKAQRLTGVEQTLNGWLALVLYILITPAFWAYQQSELNKVWRRSGEPPRVEAGEAMPADLGPGATTPSRIASDAPGGGGQPGSAVTHTTEPGSPPEEPGPPATDPSEPGSAPEEPTDFR
jgi:Zn-dependent protease with chaperone function